MPISLGIFILLELPRPHSYLVFFLTKHITLQVIRQGWQFESGYGILATVSHHVLEPLITTVRYIGGRPIEGCHSPRLA